MKEETAHAPAHPSPARRRPRPGPGSNDQPKTRIRGKVLDVTLSEKYRAKHLFPCSYVSELSNAAAWLQGVFAKTARESGSGYARPERVSRANSYLPASGTRFRKDEPAPAP